MNKSNQQQKNIVSLKKWIEKEISFEEKMGNETKEIENLLKEPDYTLSTIYFQRSVAYQKVKQQMIRLGI